MDAEKIIEAATAGTASLATGYLATLVRDLREVTKQLQGQQAEMIERMDKIETRLDGAAKAFKELKSDMLPSQAVRPDP